LDQTTITHPIKLLGNFPLHFVQQGKTAKKKDDNLRKLKIILNRNSTDVEAALKLPERRASDDDDDDDDDDNNNDDASSIKTQTNSNESFKGLIDDSSILTSSTNQSSMRRHPVIDNNNNNNSTSNVYTRPESERHVQSNYVPYNEGKKDILGNKTIRAKCKPIFIVQYISRLSSILKIRLLT
jgi:hypothetical protein